MANSLNVQTLVDGPRNTIVKVDVSLDGVSGDYANPQTIINCAVLSSMGPTFGPHPTRVRVDIIDWDVQDGLSINLNWDGAGPMPIWKLVGRSLEKAFYVGGLQNNADQPNGNITLTTTSTQINTPLFATFKLHCVKQA